MPQATMPHTEVVDIEEVPTVLREGRQSKYVTFVDQALKLGKGKALVLQPFTASQQAAIKGLILRNKWPLTTVRRADQLFIYKKQNAN